MYTKMFSSGKIGKLKIRNRTVMEPLGNALASLDGSCNQAVIEFYAARARGGVGLIMTEATSVDSKTGRANKHNLCVDDPSFLQGYAKLADAIHEYDSVIFVELYHPGRQGISACNGDRPMMAPSAVECKLVHQPVAEMTQEQIDYVIKRFVEGAVLCKNAGIDGVVLHAAHGYLIGQFLSPYTNKRNDQYGGSLENRARFALEIVQGIKDTCGDDYPIVVRMSADEFLDYAGIERTEGITPELSKEYAKMFEAAGVAAIDVSSGIYETMNTAWEPVGFDQGWKAYLAQEIKSAVQIPVICTALIRDPGYGEYLLESGICDFIGSARQHLADPEWTKKAKEGREDEIRYCISCLTCMETLSAADMTGETSRCAINPQACQESLLGELKSDGAGRTAVVIGAGPAGMEAARVLALRGFKTILFEQRSEIGGTLVFAAKPAKKERIGRLIDYYKRQFEILGVEICLNKKMDSESVKAISPYAVILATGASPVLPASIEGIQGDNVFVPQDILSGKIKPYGKKVAVVGSGMTGLETAEVLSKMCEEVAVYEMAQDIGPDMYFQTRMDVLNRLDKVSLHPGHRLMKITETGCEFLVGDDGIVQKDGDLVIMSLGVAPNKTAKEAFTVAFPNLYIVGDAKKPGKIFHAIKAGFETAAALS